jgi:rubrerythrin
MSSKELIPLFKKLLKLEEEAKNLYDGYLEKVKDPAVVKDLTLIRDQEINHVNLAKKALQILGESV